MHLFIYFFTVFQDEQSSALPQLLSNDEQLEQVTPEVDQNWDAQVQLAPRPFQDQGRVNFLLMDSSFFKLGNNRTVL